MAADRRDIQVENDEINQKVYDQSRDVNVLKYSTKLKEDIHHQIFLLERKQHYQQSIIHQQNLTHQTTNQRKSHGILTNSNVFTFAVPSNFLACSLQPATPNPTRASPNQLQKQFAVQLADDLVPLILKAHKPREGETSSL